MYARLFTNVHHIPLCLRSNEYLEMSSAHFSCATAFVVVFAVVFNLFLVLFETPSDFGTLNHQPTSARLSLDVVYICKSHAKTSSEVKLCRYPSTDFLRHRERHVSRQALLKTKSKTL